MIARRALLGSAGLALAFQMARDARRVEASPGGDRLIQEPWFLQSFLDLPEDLATAAAAGKRLAVVWELSGCPLCHAMHRDSLSDAVAASWLRTRFDWVQLDIVGAREVTFPDGTRLSEKAQAIRVGVEGTPAIQVFGAGAREIGRLTGYPGPERFLAIFRRFAETV